MENEKMMETLNVCKTGLTGGDWSGGPLKYRYIEVVNGRLSPEVQFKSLPHKPSVCVTM